MFIRFSPKSKISLVFLDLLIFLKKGSRKEMIRRKVNKLVINNDCFFNILIIKLYTN